MHAGCPPEANGDKWVVNKWIWNQPWAPGSRSAPKHMLQDYHNFLKQIKVSFLFKNPDSLVKNPDFLLKNPDFIIKQSQPEDKHEYFYKKSIVDLAAAAAADPTLAAE